jgi:uncharacterized protein (TIGR00369 family)
MEKPMNAQVQAAAAYHYGLAKPADVKGLTGKQVLQGIIDGKFPQAPISQAMSFWIVEIGDGFAAFEGEPGPHVLNPRGTVHGGWALTLIDSATGCACYSLMGPDTGYATVETKGNLSRPILHNTGRVRAEARVVSQGKQIVSAEARIFAMADGKLLAHGTSTMMVLPQQMAG